MARTREIPCTHYKCKGVCDLGKKAEFYGLCQTCPTYKKDKTRKPARVDTRKKKMEKFLRKDSDM